MFGLCEPGGRDALVLVEDLRRRPELLLEPARAVQRRRPPQRVGVAHRVRDRDLRLPRDLLQDQRHREDRRQVLGAGGLPGARIQRRKRVTRQVGEQVDPVRRNGVLAEDELCRLAHKERAYSLAEEAARARAAARALAAVLGQRHVFREAAVDVGTGGVIARRIVPRRALGSPWGHLVYRAWGKPYGEEEGGPPRWSDAAALKLERPAGVGERGTFPGPERRNCVKPANGTLGAACGNLAIS